MKSPLSRAIMALATACMGDSRQDWSLAMRAEHDVAAADGQALSFAFGCLAAAWKEMLTSAVGRLVLTTHVVALGIMIPMAALQFGCAIFGLPYLYPGQHGLSRAILVGGSHEVLLRGVYQKAVPSLALIQMLAGFGHVRLAWSLVERDWSGAFRWAIWTFSAATALVIFMGVLFLDGRQALAQSLIVGVEIAIVMIAARRHAELRSPTGVRQPG